MIQSFLKISLTSLIFFTSSVVMACPFQVGVYSCNNATVNDPFIKDLVVRTLTVVKKGNQRHVTWNATGNVWIQDDENSGHYEKQDFDYVTDDLTPGDHLIEKNVYQNVSCENYANGLQQAYVVTRVQIDFPEPDGSQVHLRTATYSQKKNLPKEFSASVSNLNASFSCFKK